MKGVGYPVNVNGLTQLLFVLRNADMTLVTDQTLTKQFGGTSYVITSVVFKRVAGAFGVACAGGIYDTAAKGGNAFVAAGQSYASMTGANTATVATLAAVASTIVSTATPILSLTTGNTGALNADVFIYGVCVD